MEKNNTYTGNRILFIVVMVFLFLPMIQGKFKIVHEKDLHGDVPPEKPVFSFKNYLEGEFQDKKEIYFNHNFGFRKFCVRLNNQISYSFFKEARAKDVIVGKDEYLYEKLYIDTYLGKDFIGEKAILEKVRKLKMIQDTLKKKDIDLFVVLTPGKAQFFPEYIPDKYFKEKPTISNYSVYVKDFEEKGINFIDFNKWFSQMKDTIAYPLFPKTGIHWSTYGGILAADSIVKYISSVRQIEMPKIIQDKIELTKKLQGEDDDIEKGMNLLYAVPNHEMAYPSFRVVSDSKTMRPKVLTVGDSFYFQIFNSGIAKEIFNNSEFWYYYEKIFPEDPNNLKTLADVNVPVKVEKNDVIMLMVTDANLGSFSYGFIDDLYDFYFKK